MKKDAYHALAKRRWFSWVGEHPKNTKIPTEWQCSKGHRWLARYSTIQHGSGCPQCDRELNYISLEDYYALAKERGFIWNGDLPKNSHANSEWRCVSDHTWMATYKNIKSGCGCPNCLNSRINGIKSSKPQQAIFDMLGGIQNHKIGRLSIDIALQLPTTNIAVEFDGWYFHGNRLEHDKERSQSLNDAGWKVVSIKAGKLIPSLDVIQDAIYRLLAGSDYEEIIMPDWEKGTAR